MTTITLELIGLDKATGIIEGVHGALGGISSLVGGALKASLAVGAAGFGALAVGAGAAFIGAMEAEEQMAQVEAVIKSTGGAAGISAQEIAEWGSALQKTTKFSDDQVIEAEKLLLTFTNIGRDVFPQATTALLDMATIMGTDARGGAVQLGKALNNPVEGITALTRVGVAFTDEQKEMIASLVEAGDIAGAQAIILKELQAEFGGAAEAAGDTAAGKIKIFQNVLADAGETVAGAVLPAFTELFERVIMPAIPIIERLAEGLAVAFDILASGEEDIGGAVDAFGEFANDVLPGSAEALRQMYQVAQEAIDSFQPIIMAAQNVAAAFAESMPMIQESVREMKDFVLEQINILSPTLIANVTQTLNSLAEFWRAHGDEIMAVVKFTFEFIATFVGTTLTLLSGTIAATMQIINGDWSGAWATIKETARSFMEAVLNLVDSDLDTFIADWRGNFELAKLIVLTVFDDMIEGVNSAAAGLERAILGPIRSIIRKAKDLLGIDSPSSVFKEIGANVMQGLGAGLNEYVGWLSDVMLGPLQDMIAQAEGALGVHSPSAVMAGVGRGAAFGAGAAATIGGPSFVIDARGSQLSAAQIEYVVRRVLSENERAQDAAWRMR